MENLEYREVVTDMATERARLNMSLSEFYAIPGKDDSDSKLPIFDEAHIRAALSRFNQVQGVSAEELAKAKAKIIARAKKYNIDTSGFEGNKRSLDDYYEKYDTIINAFKK